MHPADSTRATSRTRTSSSTFIAAASSCRTTGSSKRKKSSSKRSRCSRATRRGRISSGSCTFASVFIRARSRSTSSSNGTQPAGPVAQVEPRSLLSEDRPGTGGPNGAREPGGRPPGAQNEAWGYLGLAHERLGDLHKAVSAFERAGHRPDGAAGHREARDPDREHRARRRGTLPRRRARRAKQRHEARWRLPSRSSTPARSASPSPNRSPARSNPGPGARWSPARRRAPGSERQAGGRVDRAAERRGRSPRCERRRSPPRRRMVPRPRSPPLRRPLPACPRFRTHFPIPLTQLAHATHTSPSPRRRGRPPAAGRDCPGEDHREHAGGGGRPFAARVEGDSGPRRRARARGPPSPCLGEVVPGESFGGVASSIASVAGTGCVWSSRRARRTRSSRSLSRRRSSPCVRTRSSASRSARSPTRERQAGPRRRRVLPTSSSSAAAARVLLELLHPLRSVDVTEGRPILVQRDSLIGWTGGEDVGARAPSVRGSVRSRRGLLSLAGDGTIFLAVG